MTQQTVEPSARVPAAVIAERYGVSERTVQRLAAAGKIPSYRVGHQLRFDLTEVGTALREAAA